MCRAFAADRADGALDRRIVVAASQPIALAIPFEGVRRVQFDTNRTQAASSTGGAKATFSLTGRTLAFVSRLGPTEGTAPMYVDGTRVDLTIDPHDLRDGNPESEVQ